MRHLLLAATCLAALPSFALAQEVGEVIVTATRLPSAAEDIPGVRVIGEEEIETRQSVFAMDVLNTVPGLSVFRTGGAGGSTSIRMRGAESDKTLVLIDGIPVNDPSLPDGGYDMSALDLSDVKRIEILAGPQGSIWGSDAIGGVVSFTTRELDGWRAQVEAGSFGAARASAAFGMADDGQAFGVAVSGYRTDGISAVATGTEKDGFETWTAAVNGRKDLGTVRIDGRLRYTDSLVEQDGYDSFFVFGDTDSWYESQAWSGFVRGAASDPFLNLRHTVSFSAYDIARASHSLFSSSYEADRQVWRWQAEGGKPADPIAFVVGAEREDTHATVSIGEAEEGATAAFAVVRWTPMERLTTTSSLRYDDPDTYEGEATARVSAAYEAGAGFTLSAAWGQGFKTPTISHTVCDFCFPPGPSTDLTPERAEGWDLRVAWESDLIRADITGYRLSVRDQIAYAGRYVNLERTLTKGIEAQGELKLNEVASLRAAFAYTDAIDAVTGAELYRAPTHTGSVSVDWRRDRMRGALTLRAEGEQADIDPATFTPTTRQGFVVIDLANAWTLREGLELTGRIENLSDQDFQEVFGYGEYGRAAYVGLRLKR